VGKIAVPDKILHKQDRLNDYEQHIMRKHPEVGFRFVTGASFLSEAAKVILHHHECWDGSGYPHGLSGEQIPIGARIFTVVDAYDSMRANRVYRASMTPAQAESELRDKAGSQFDPHVVEVFLQHLDEIEDIGHWQGIEGE
jgi:response regulator RpfG family c-di-GMP phosphodiesterase